MANESIKIELSDESRKAITDMIGQLKEIQKTLGRIGEQYVKQARRSADRIAEASRTQRTKAGR